MLIVRPLISGVVGTRWSPTISLKHGEGERSESQSERAVRERQQQKGREPSSLHFSSRPAVQRAPWKLHQIQKGKEEELGCTSGERGVLAGRRNEELLKIWKKIKLSGSDSRRSSRGRAGRPTVAPRRKWHWKRRSHVALERERLRSAFVRTKLDLERSALNFSERAFVLNLRVRPTVRSSAFVSVRPDYERSSRLLSSERTSRMCPLAIDLKFSVERSAFERV
ncbi:hypothetical protein LR48_Vigan468s005300 [Vigna angularis]|uniref:Uncharacterized protein n=1 Tax=Phaseolus angularis TaxID=3914 RepID=A0A0L9TBW6_PHAAN|nr:hypothetical protein LR48_Vigan468s005300 [Vigna angularis]